MPLIATDKLEREGGQAIFFKLGNNEATIISAMLEAYIDSFKRRQRTLSDENAADLECFILKLAAIEDDLNDMIDYWFRKDEEKL